MSVVHPREWTGPEAITVVVVVSSLLALIVLGLPHAREATRRHHCSSNLRLIAEALQSYHHSFGMLPPAAIRAQPKHRIELQDLNSRSSHYSISRVYANWALLLLPYLAHDQSAASFDPRAAITDNANREVRRKHFPLMICPTDTYNRSSNAYRVLPTSGGESMFARGNYAINGGVGGNSPGSEDSPGVPWAPVPDGMTRQHVAGLSGTIEMSWGSGIAGFNKSFSVRAFKNGLSNLVAIDEVRAGILPADSRGTWALGEVGASITWWHGLLGDAGGPNNKGPRSDDIVGCNQLHEEFGEAALVRKGMPCCSYTSVAGQATSRSMHLNGVNTLLMDGSTRFFADAVDSNVWHAMHSRGSRKVSIPGHEPYSQGEVSVSFAKRLRRSSQKLSSSFVNSIGMTLVEVPKGEFIMGLPDEGHDHNTPVTGVPPEAPPHTVRITSDLFMGAFEVTQQQYEHVMGSNPSWHIPTNGPNVNAANERLGLPVEQASWFDAVAFCGKLSSFREEQLAGRRYRLPTEAEWEYCCRAGSKTPFRVPQASDQVHTGFNVLVGPDRGKPITRVGSYEPNAFGLFDMRGNVWEWCADWYASDYYCRSPRDDPQGPARGVLKVVRGADWRFTGMGCKYARFHTEPWRSNRYIGFRVVCEHLD